jgi:5-methylcytosine-specific restriction endonuclease McrA
MKMVDSASATVAPVASIATLVAKHHRSTPLSGDTWRVQRHAARARDGYRCWLCGLEERLNKALTGRGLSVHHVRRKEEFDTLE